MIEIQGTFKSSYIRKLVTIETLGMSLQNVYNVYNAYKYLSEASGRSWVVVRSD